MHLFIFWELNMKSKPKLKLKLIASFTVASLFTAASTLTQATEAVKFQGDVLVAANGMTLYTFDKDAANKSNCNDGCLKAWPALIAAADTKVSGEFSIVTRDDGVKQIAMNGKPLYFYVADQKAGDVTGDGSGGVWHAIRNGQTATQSTSPRRAAAPAQSSGYAY
jgi:predicted lipoprotein with Yx(FWY)xxD motif